MGRGPGDAEGGGTCLVEDDASDVRQLAADLINQHLACLGMRLATVLTLDQKRFDSCGGSADQAARTAIEAALPGRSRRIPRLGDQLIVADIGCRATSKRLDETKSMANASKPRNGLGINQWPRLW